MFKFSLKASLLIAGAALPALASPAFAQENAAQDSALLERLSALEARFEALADENESLRSEVERLRAPSPQLAPAPVMTHAAARAPQAGEAPQLAYEDVLVGTSSTYGYQMLDHAVHVTTKPLLQLEAIQAGELDQRVTVSGSVTAIANSQWSNVDSKFGYLMRNPTSANQIGDRVSEALLHAASFGVTARVAPSVTAYAELLYDPQQSFGAGTITALARNQIQLRRGWVMLGNLDKAPVYALVGKMDTPFGLQDTVSPFTNSTNWHAFAGLAYGAQAGFVSGGLHLRAMAIQGGAQFRSANVPVEGTAVPSRLNNFAVDARYTLALGGIDNSLLVGASYKHGTAYCQAYPVFHFNPCADNNPGVVAYGKLHYGPLTLLGEYAQTTDVWAGTAVPDPTNPLSIFDAVKPSAFTVGGRLGFGEQVAAEQRRAFALSGEFSKFIAGDDGAPWERQTQVVVGGSWFPVPNVNMFGELIHVDGFVPLNFVSGGNFPDGSTWSEQGVNTNVVLVGAQVAF